MSLDGAGEHCQTGRVQQEIISRRCCLCLHCRTALLPSQPCDCGEEAEVACFELADEREKIVAAVWGDPERQAKLEHFAERTSRRVTSASLGGFVAGMAATVPLVGVGPAMALFGTLGCLAGGAYATHRSRLGRFGPSGVAPLSPDESIGLRAKLEGEHQLISPAAGHKCLAYFLELRVFGGGREHVVYRDSVTSGFTTTLDDGERAEVPAGRLRYTGMAPEILDVDNLELAAYLSEVDPLGNSAGMLNPLHYDVVREEVLFAGDQVELSGTFEPVALPVSPSLYRERTPTRLRPQGMVEVRRRC